MSAQSFAVLALVAVAACGKSNKPASTEHEHTAATATDAATAPDPDDPWAPKPPDPERVRCERLDFADSIPIAEASGAAYVPPSDGAPEHVLVVGDSGTVGQYVELDPASGAVLARGHLPLDKGASDDLEGLARVGATLYTITSSGYARHHRRAADGTYSLDTPAYPVGDPPASCPAATAVNCGRNYEGLCLVEPPPATGCAGFAASKTDGALYCLTFDADGRLHTTDAPAIGVTGGEELTGCSFDAGGQLWVGTNLFGGNAVYRVTGWADPKGAKITKIGAGGPGFSEAITTGPDGVLYRFADDSSAPSLAEKYVCE